MSNHQQLWAPWRLAYLKGNEPQEPAPERTFEWLDGCDPTCFICRAVADRGEGSDRRNLVVHRTPNWLVMLNRYPYNNGHLLISPLTHRGELSQLSGEQRLEGIDLIDRMVGIIRQQMNAEGFNIGLNLGRVAGAGLPGHLHWHIVPRWQGDNNFMPAVASVRVIPQALETLWELLTAALKNQS